MDKDICSNTSDKSNDEYKKFLNESKEAFKIFMNSLTKYHIKAKRKELTDKIKKDIINNYKDCYICGENLTPILLIHHILPLSEFGDNSSFNLICLCPNCHKKIHYLYDSKAKDFKNKTDVILSSYSSSEREKCIELCEQYFRSGEEGTKEYIAREYTVSKLIDKYLHHKDF